MSIRSGRDLSNALTGEPGTFTIQELDHRIIQFPVSLQAHLAQIGPAEGISKSQFTASHTQQLSEKTGSLLVSALIFGLE